MDGMLNQMDAHLQDAETLIAPAPESRPRTPFDDDTVPPDEISMLNLSPWQRLRAAVLRRLIHWP